MPNSKEKDPEQPFSFPRYYQYAASFRGAIEDIDSHWLTNEEFHKSKWLTAERIRRRPMDRGNIKSRWTKQRLEDQNELFDVSKYGVPVKKVDRDRSLLNQYSRVDYYEDPTTKTGQVYSKDLAFERRGPNKDGTWPLDSNEFRGRINSVHSKDSSESSTVSRSNSSGSFSFSDSGSGSDSGSETSLDDQDTRPTNDSNGMNVQNQQWGYPDFYPSKSTQKIFPWYKFLPELKIKTSRRFLTPATAATSRQIDLDKRAEIKFLEDEFHKIHKHVKKPKRTAQEVEDIKKMLKGELSGPINVTKDYLHWNARQTMIIPPKRPVPTYVDDTKGTRNRYCPSGLARIFIYKSDYGIIPEYLKKRNEEQGRPPIPDFRKFYKYHVCKYVYGHYHCQMCKKKHACIKYPRDRRGDPGDIFCDQNGRVRPPWDPLYNRRESQKGC